MKKYFAEFVGTFGLALVVLMSVAAGPNVPIPVPVIAGIVVGLFVYTIGPISGCHINPSVTIGQLSVGKISMKDACSYIVAQFLGAFFAVGIAGYLMISGPSSQVAASGQIFIAEMLGAFFLNFGIASVVYGKAKAEVSGLVIGGSIVIGVLASSFAGAAGIINPAIAFTLNSLTFLYLIAPIVGSIVGYNVYQYIIGWKE